MRTKKKRTLKNMVVFDPVGKRFIQKSHIVHGRKVLNYPIVKCQNCGNDYPKKRVDQSFCCTPCRLEWHEKKRRDGKEPDLSLRVCPICGETFTPTREWNKYDTDRCRAEARRKKLAESRQALSAPV